MTGTMLSHALYASFTDTAEQRVSDRRTLRLEARVATPAGDGGVEVHNLSRTGMLVECASDVPVGSAIVVELPGGTTHQAEVVWVDEGLFGCRFAAPLSQAQLAAAQLRSAPKPVETAIPNKRDQAEAFTRLREHWGMETDAAAATERKLPLGTRLWIILGLAMTGWAVPAAAAWMFF